MRVAPYNVNFGHGLGSPDPVQSAPVHKPDAVTLSGKAPKFGCRLFAYMNSDPDNTQSRFLKDCLIKGDNAMMKQSMPRKANPDHDGVYSWDDLPLLPVHKDGWGIAAYTDGEKAPTLVKQPEGASTDPRYKRAVKDVVKKRPNVLMAHVRYATVGNHTTENTHPFQYGNWLFMHNGGVYGKVMDDIRTKIAMDYAPKLGHGPHGQTDSEAIFYYLLGKLADKYPGVDLSQSTLDDVPPEELFDTFRDTVREILDGEQQHREYPLARFRIASTTGLNLTAESRMEVAPACNYVVSNGKLMMAAAYSHKLYLGTRKVPNREGLVSRMRDKLFGVSEVGRHIEASQERINAPNTEVVISSEKIRPRGVDKARMRWIEVPVRHAVLLERGEEGIKVTLKPF